MNKKLTVGDVFFCPKGKYNTLVLVQAIYNCASGYQLLGMGLSPNSNIFYGKTHTLEEICHHIDSHRMIHAGNINNKVIYVADELVKDFKNSYNPKSGDIYKLKNGELIQVIEQGGRYRVIFGDFSVGDVWTHNVLVEFLRFKEAVFQKNIGVDKLFS